MTMESMEYGIPTEEQMTQQPDGLPETTEPGLAPESPDHLPREDAEASGTPEPVSNEGEAPEAAPKKKRTAKKKAEKAEGAVPEAKGAMTRPMENCPQERRLCFQGKPLYRRSSLPRRKRRPGLRPPAPGPGGRRRATAPCCL